MRASSRPSRRQGGHHGARRDFTLTELLIAASILVVMSLILVGISEQVTQIWTRGESQNQHRVRARAALELIGREMRQALLPLDASDMRGLQFVINPSALGPGSPDTVFWQASVARDKSQGDLAEIGYFIRWDADGTASLCRFYVPSGNASYLIYSQPTAWITKPLLDLLAPADKAHTYQGLFLENVVGLWAVARAADGTPYAGGYDSRAHANQLPACVDISLAFLDTKTAGRIKGHPNLAAGLQNAVRSASDAEAFLALLNGNQGLHPFSQGASAASFRVPLSNANP